MGSVPGALKPNDVLQPERENCSEAYDLSVREAEEDTLSDICWKSSWILQDHITWWNRRLTCVESTCKRKRSKLIWNGITKLTWNGNSELTWRRVWCFFSLCRSGTCGGKSCGTGSWRFILQGTSASQEKKLLKRPWEHLIFIYSFLFSVSS